MAVGGRSTSALVTAGCSAPRRAFLRNEELRGYLVLIGGRSAIFADLLVSEDRYSLADAVRHGVFQPVSTITTTGYASADFATWSAPALLLLLLLMFPGGCSGSTGGAIKIVRARLADPGHAARGPRRGPPGPVQPIRTGRRPSTSGGARGVGFVLLYVVIFIVGAILLATDASARGFRSPSGEALAASATALATSVPASGRAVPWDRSPTSARRASR